MARYDDVCILASEETYEELRVKAESIFGSNGKAPCRPSDVLGWADSEDAGHGLQAHWLRMFKWYGDAVDAIAEAIGEMAEAGEPIELARASREDDGDTEWVHGDDCDMPVHLGTRSVIEVWS